VQRQNCWNFRVRTTVRARRYCTILLLIEQTTALLCVTEATLDPLVKTVGDSQSQGWMVAWQSFGDRRKPRRRLASWSEAFYYAGSRSSSCCPSVCNNYQCVGYLAVTEGSVSEIRKALKLGNAIGLVTRLLACPQMNMVRLLESARRFFLLCKFRSGSGDHPAHLVGTDVPSHWSKYIFITKQQLNIIIYFHMELWFERLQF